MQEDWLKDIYGKMSDFEADEPSGLWDDICKARQQDKEPEPTYRSKAVVLWWTKRIAAVAAMVVFIFSAGYLEENDKELPSIALNTTDIKAPGTEEMALDRSLHDVSEGKRLGSSVYSNLKTAAKIQLAKTAPIIMEPDETITDTVSAAENNRSDTAEDTSDMPVETFLYTDKRQGKTNTTDYIASANIGKNNSGKLSCKMFITGGAGSAFNRKSAGSISPAVIGPDGSSWKDSPLLGILLYNEGKDVETDIKHRLPIRAGLSFAYEINKRFSLGSGVSYANLSSDMRQGSDNHYFTGIQTLHYVGIPLDIRYNIVSWKGIELYASTGLLAEKCVSGKLKKEYILNNRAEKKETQNLNENPLQWSVNASAGLQYNVTPSIGIYAEPGISYYFNDGTSLKTIYKDRPFNFNLNLGLRFTFGWK